jgi:hypothetical protein
MELNANAIDIKSLTGGTIFLPEAFRLNYLFSLRSFRSSQVNADETWLASQISQQAASVVAFDLYSGRDQITCTLPFPHLLLVAPAQQEDCFITVTTIQLISGLSTDDFSWKWPRQPRAFISGLAFVNVTHLFLAGNANQGQLQARKKAEERKTKHKPIPIKPTMHHTHSALSKN